MSRAEVETFRRRIRDLREKYEHDLNQIEQDLARRKGVDWVEVKGSGRDVALEAHARTYVIDPLLRELGWDVSCYPRLGADPLARYFRTHPFVA